MIPLLLLFHVTTGRAAPAPSKERLQPQVQMQHLETELSREKEKFELFNIKEKDLMARLARMEKGVSRKRAELASIKKQIRGSSLKIRSLNQKMANLEKSLKATETQLMQRLVVLYKYARPGYMKILATAANLDQFRLRVKYLRAITQEDWETLRTLAEEKKNQEMRIGALGKEILEARSRKQEEEKKLAILKKNLEEKIILLMKTHREKEFYKTGVKELAAGAESLKNTLQDVEKRPAAYGGRMGTSHFADEKGSLPLPFDGRILRGSQVLGSAAGRLRPGVYIEGKGEEEVRCLFPGRVEFSGELKGYGQMIIINHGSRFFSIFAELDRRMKKKGDRVRGGDVIGVVGDDGQSGVSRVYLELRHGRKILDPMKWLAAR